MHWKIIIYLILWIILQMITYFMLKFMCQRASISMSKIILKHINSISYGSSLCIVVMLCFLDSEIVALAKTTTEYFSFSLEKFLMYSFISVFIAILLFCMNTGFSKILYRCRKSSKAIHKERFASNGSPFYIVMVPILEELIFRGMLFLAFLQVFSREGAIYFTAICFGLIHVTPKVALMTFVGSLALSWLFIMTGSLVYPVISHGIYNGLVYLYQKKDSLFMKKYKVLLRRKNYEC